jgi:hypothetical protein
MKKIYMLFLFVTLCLFMFDGNIRAQDPVCVKLYEEGLVLKKQRSYREAIKRFNAARECDAKLQGDCEKRISECEKAIGCQNLYNEGLALKEQKKCQEAIKKFEAAGICDAALREDCEKRISECKGTPAPTPAPDPTIRLSKERSRFSEQGGVDNITVSGGSRWTVSGSADWCDAKRSGNLVVITCRQNKTLLPRTVTIEIKSGRNSETIVVEQDAAEEPVSVRLSKERSRFSEQGGVDNITVSGDSRWSVSGGAGWCDVKQVDNLIKITCEQNKTLFSREATIEVKGSRNSGTVVVEQDAAKEYLAVSKEKIEYPSSGGTDTVRVSTNNESWMFGDIPEWCNVEETGDGFIIACRKNRTDQARRGTIQIKTNRQTAVVEVRQEVGRVVTPVREDAPKPAASTGRKISFGIMANVLMPSFSVTSSSVQGSVVNYGYGGKSEEKPSYSSAETGYSGGLIADIRITKNVYIQTGLYYTNLKVNNEVNRAGQYKMENYTSATYLEGTVSYKYREEYTLNYIELPVLFSWRYYFSPRFIWQINAGPYIGYGIAGKAKINGADSYEMGEYSYQNDLSTGDSYQMSSNYTGETDLFGKAGKLSRTYTTGDRPRYDRKYDIKNPFLNLDAGVSFGTVFEYAGINAGVYYDTGLMNIANEDYWKSQRMRMPGDDIEPVSINNYVHKINKLQIRIGYIYRW